MYKCYGNCQQFEVPPPIGDYSRNLIIEEVPCNNIHDPKVWGSAWWFSLFNGCCTAERIIPNADRVKYWKFIEGLPYMLPCRECQGHAKIYVENHKHAKDSICSSRRNLLKFFVDLHNTVSKRKGQQKIKVKDVEDMFMSNEPVNAIRVKYS